MSHPAVTPKHISIPESVGIEEILRFREEEEQLILEDPVFGPTTTDPDILDDIPHKVKGEFKKIDFSLAQLDRMNTSVCIPPALEAKSLKLVSRNVPEVLPAIKKLFPSTFDSKIQSLVADMGSEKKRSDERPLRVGVVLSGGQASGGHNVIAGIFDYIKRVNSNSQLIGFTDGPKGIFTNKHIEITNEYLQKFRNQGGFDMLRSGRDKIEKEQQFADSLTNCSNLDLHGLIVIGGDDSNTNAAVLAEYFKSKNSKVNVVGVPKTIDGDLKNKYVEMSFGFETACRVYSECIGNLCIDSASFKGNYHFVRLMGRSASHLTLECALQTHPTVTFISEEIFEKKISLSGIISYLCNVIEARHKLNKNFGIILVPEGLIEFIPEMTGLIKELNEIIPKLTDEKREINKKAILSRLTKTNVDIFKYLPVAIQNQLLLDRDAHGNVYVSKIDTERLLVLLVEKELQRRKASFTFYTQSHFFGYEGRSSLPSDFDSNYSYSLGMTAAALVANNCTGYMSTINNIAHPVSEWELTGVPLVAMMNIEHRKGKDVPVIKKSLVELNSKIFRAFEAVRDKWALYDCFRSPGPIQFYGPNVDTTVNYTIQGDVDLKELVPPHVLKAPNIAFNFSEQSENKDIEKIASSVEKDSLSPWVLKSLSCYSPLQIDRMKDDADYLPFNLHPVSYSLQDCDDGFEVSEGDLLSPSFETREALHNLFLQISSSAGKTFSSSDDKATKSVLEIIPSPAVKKSPAHLTKFSGVQDLNELRIGFCFLGRQSPGGHNVIDGVLRYFEHHNNPKNWKLFGFIGGSFGLFESNYFEITRNNFKPFLNQGGYEFLGLGPDSVRTKDEFQKTAATCLKLKLNGLIMVGATHTLTDAALLSYYLQVNLPRESQVSVIGVPASMDGNIKHHLHECSLGFDTTTKVYSEFIGNILIDAASAAKSWYFIRLMGRDPSHLVLESSLQTHPNVCIIGEEEASDGTTLEQLVNRITDVMIKRSKEGKDYGMVLIPEGLLGFIPHFKQLITDLNKIFVSQPLPRVSDEVKSFQEELDTVSALLPPWSRELLLTLPILIKSQLLYSYRSHNTINISHIETERLLSELVIKDAKERFKKKVNITTHFFGYQGRSSLPTLFDCRLASTFGYSASVFIAHNVENQSYTSLMVSARGCTKAASEWRCIGIPIQSLMTLTGSSIYGSNKPRVPSAGVDLKGRPYLFFKKFLPSWLSDSYLNAGPIQYYGPLNGVITVTLREEQKYYFPLLKEVENLCDEIKKKCKFGIRDEMLRGAVLQLRGVRDVLTIMQECLLPMKAEEFSAYPTMGGGTKGLKRIQSIRYI